MNIDPSRFLLCVLGCMLAGAIIQLIGTAIGIEQWMIYVLAGFAGFYIGRSTSKWVFPPKSKE